MSDGPGASLGCSPLRGAENNPSETGSQYFTLHRGAFTKKEKEEEIGGRRQKRMDSRLITLNRNRQGQALGMTEGETSGRRPRRRRGRGEEDGFPLETGGNDGGGRDGLVTLGIFGGFKRILVRRVSGTRMDSR